MRGPLVVLLSLAVACSARSAKEQGGLTVREQVSFYCHDLTRELDHAADVYTKLAPQLDGSQLAPDQRRRVEQIMQVDSIGATYDVRVEKVQAIQARMQFCLGVHELDGADAIAARIGVLVQKLREQDVDGVFAKDASGSSSPEAAAALDVIRRDTISKHVEAAHLLDQLAVLARQIDAASLKD